ncbi:MerR family transcriptional regulator [Methylomonas sp. AM2-LC]|uniref:MerR family transcriptional regulator n=1 Tax=Methylomonas sp. AM2-LC TaxID=3153301 RepID=UPI003267DAA2
MYSIKAISSLTGLGAETLRAWERRYGTVAPKRDEGGRRYYSQLDLEHLMLLANLSRQGHSIGKLTGLSISELQKLQQVNKKTQENYQEFIEQIGTALSEYRFNQCEQMLKRALMAKEPLPYLRDVLIPALIHVGDLWHEQKISIAQEHMFSACVKRILLGMVNSLQSLSGNRPAMMFATPSGEPHEFGVLMCCLLAAEQDFDCYYLGANVPADDLLLAAKKLQIEVLVLGLTKSPTDPETLIELNKLAAASANNNAVIWLGGSALNQLYSESPGSVEQCELIADIDDFYAKAKQWRYKERER